MTKYNMADPSRLITIEEVALDIILHIDDELCQELRRNPDLDDTLERVTRILYDFKLAEVVQ